MGDRKLLSCVLAVAACAPVTTSRRVIETPRDGGVKRDEPHKGKAEVGVVANADGFVVSLDDALLCVERHVTLVHRVEVKKRHVNTGVTVLEYVLGLGLGGAGGFAAASPQTIVDQNPDKFHEDEVRPAGIATAGVGALFLTFGIINSVRGGTSRHDLGDEARPDATGNTVPCGTAPRAGEDVSLAIGDGTWPVGKTGADGKVTVAWSAIAAEVFDRDWHAATVKTAGVEAKVDLTAARPIVGEREWVALQAAPNLEAARRYRARFVGMHADELKTMLAQLADATYGPAIEQALAKGDAQAARQAMTAWMTDAPTSAQRMRTEGEVVELEHSGTVDYLYAKYEAAIAYADGDPAKLDEAERVVTVLADKAPADARVVAAREVVTKKRTAMAANRVRDAKAHADRAKHHARHAEWDKADAEIAAANKLAPEEQVVIAAAQYVNDYKQKAGIAIVAVQQPAKADPTRTDAAKADAAAQAKADAAAKAKADADEKLRLAAAAKAQLEQERAEKARLAAEAKQKADEERAEKARLAAEAKQQADEERARKAAEAKAAADAERARIAEEKAKQAELRARTDQEKQQAREEAKAAAAERARIAAEEKARVAAEQKAKREEAARIAAEEKAKRDEAARATQARLAAEEKAKREEAARIAAEEKARRDAARGRVPSRPAVEAPAYVGLWATTVGPDTVWLLDLQAAGKGRTAVWIAGQIVAVRDIAWGDESAALVVSTTDSQLRGPSSELTDTGMRWAGVTWRRQ